LGQRKKEEKLSEEVQLGERKNKRNIRINKSGLKIEQRRGTTRGGYIKYAWTWEAILEKEIGDQGHGTQI